LCTAITKTSGAPQLVNQNMDMDYNARVKMGHHTHTHRHMDIERYIRQKGWNITRFSCGHFCFSAVLGSKRFMANFTVADSNLHSQTHGHKGKSIGRNLLQRPERRRKWSRLSSHLTPTPTHCIRRGVHTTRNTIE